MDTDDSDFDPNAWFDINAPAQGKVMFQILPVDADVVDRYIA